MGIKSIPAEKNTLKKYSLVSVKLAVKVLILSTSKLSTLVFKLAKSVFDTSVDVSMPIAPFRSSLVA